MVTETVTGSLEGGAKLEKYLAEKARSLGAGGSVAVGFLEGATYPITDDNDEVLPVAQVAFWMNFGTTKSPARPFFTNMIEDQMPTWAKKLGAAIRYSNYRIRPALDILGADIAGHLIESINLLQDPPLSPYTIEKKGFAKPLIDSGLMVSRRAISWKVTTDAPNKESST